MGLISEFKEFAMKGNVMDMAVGVIIGGAFGKIVSSLVDDILMPLVGMLTGNIDFSKLAFKFGEGDLTANLTYGNFIQNILQFLIVAFALFAVIIGMNKLRRPAPEAAPTTKICPFCKNEVPIEATRCGHCTSELK